MIMCNDTLRHKYAVIRTADTHKHMHIWIHGKWLLCFVKMNTSYLPWNRKTSHLTPLALLERHLFVFSVKTTNILTQKAVALKHTINKVEDPR